MNARYLGLTSGGDKATARRVTRQVNHVFPSSLPWWLTDGWLPPESVEPLSGCARYLELASAPRVCLMNAATELSVTSLAFEASLAPAADSFRHDGSPSSIADTEPCKGSEINPATGTGLRVNVLKRLRAVSHRGELAGTSRFAFPRAFGTQSELTSGDDPATYNNSSRGLADDPATYNSPLRVLTLLLITAD